ncbi:hypothetical protein MTO96_016714 [Rhipicephalus appendiculatus]
MDSPPRAKEAGIAIDRACRQPRPAARRSATIKSARRRKTQWVVPSGAGSLPRGQGCGASTLKKEDTLGQWTWRSRRETKVQLTESTSSGRHGKTGRRSPGSRIACLAGGRAAITRRRPHARLDR